jgi:hypothetical protein
MKYMIKNMSLRRQTLEPKLRRRLLEDSREDAARLERLLGRDLSIWDTGEQAEARG